MTLASNALLYFMSFSFRWLICWMTFTLALIRSSNAMMCTRYDIYNINYPFAFDCLSSPSQIISLQSAPKCLKSMSIVSCLYLNQSSNFFIYDKSKYFWVVSLLIQVAIRILEYTFLQASTRMVRASVYCMELWFVTLVAQWLFACSLPTHQQNKGLVIILEW